MATKRSRITRGKGRIHAGFENAEAVVVCERGDELGEDETTGENLTMSSMFENILKEAVELSRVDWETLAKWQDIKDITKVEEKRGPTRSTRHPIVFLFPIVNFRSKSSTRTGQSTREIGKFLSPFCEKIFCRSLRKHSIYRTIPKFF